MHKIPDHIRAKIGRNLHLQPNHPIAIVKQLIVDTLPEFRLFDDLQPKVSTEANFDHLLIPPDHVSRKPTDTYYVDDNTVLRTHTSAHQVELLRKGETQFLVAGDVYRRDAIDATHYPVFHQIEGVKLFHKGVSCLTEKQVEEDLRTTVEKILGALFPGSPLTWKDDYFPFTNPSFEIEVGLDGKQMEVLGCGVVQPKVLQFAENLLDAHGWPLYNGWAFGMGLERLAMKLFSIPDIRLFWSTDERFTSQFKAGQITKFKPYSKYPACYKDVAFWAPDSFNENDFTDLVRAVAGDLVESVSKIDSFTKASRTSHCFRVMYRSHDRSLTNEEVDEIQNKVRAGVGGWTGFELR